MAFKLKDVNGYGTGALGTVTNPSGQINSYANVTAYTATSITIGTPSNGIYETFTAGTEIALCVSAGNGTSTDTAYLGAKLHCRITAVSGSVLTIDKDFTAVLPATSFLNYQVQAITVANFASLILSSGSITPPAYSVSNKYGGILLLKCTDTATFSGGSINLVDKGIPVASLAYRPKTAQELQGTADTDKYSGWENSETLRKFLLNAGDGAAFIMAKHYVQSGTTSRIGGTAAGVQYTRGTIGGSTIALVAGDMTGFDPSIISKTKGSGQGLGRCYIASNTKQRNDEGLYAYDCISDPLRLMRTLNIKGYEDGALGSVTNPTVPLNNYASITGISVDGKQIAYTNKTTTGMAPIAAGATVMFHVSKPLDTSDMGYLSKFILAKVLSDDGNTLLLDTSVTKVFDPSQLSKYNCQIISVAQFLTLTLSAQYTATTAWNDTTKMGGICAVACKTKCDITDGGIIVTGKGGGIGSTAADGYTFFGNTQCNDVLPLGSSGGAIFLLTPLLKGNENSRLGNTWTGAGTMGAGGNGAGGAGGPAGGYAGGKGGAGGPAVGNAGPDTTTAGSGGPGAGGGGAGGYTNGGKGADAVLRPYNKMVGVNLFIVAYTVDGFNIEILSTGGYGGAGGYTQYGVSGSVGYPGGAGYPGGGGGGSASISSIAGNVGGIGGLPGYAFIYCNNVINADMTGVAA